MTSQANMTSAKARRHSFATWDLQRSSSQDSDTPPSWNTKNAENGEKRKKLPRWRKVSFSVGDKPDAIVKFLTSHRRKSRSYEPPSLPSSPEYVCDYVCHHHDCQENNQGKPLTLCADCDRAIHGSPRNSGHLRFDAMRKQGLPLSRHQSSLSLPGATSSSNKSDEEEDEEERESDRGEEEEEEEEEEIRKRNTQFKDSRRKSKPRRYNTEEQSIPESEIFHSRSQSLQETGFDQRHLGEGLLKSNDREAMLRSRDRMTGSPTMHSPQISRSRHSSGPGPQRWGSEQHLHSVYTPDELKYTPLRRISPNQPQRKPDHSHGVINKLLLIDGATNAPRSRKVSLPVPAHRSDSFDADKDKKYSLGMEVFTLRFDIIDENDVEIIAAVKGVTLRDAVKPSFDKRHLDLKKVGVFLSLSNTPLPLDYDCFPLGGNKLHVKAKDDSPLLKKSPISKTSSASLSSIPAAIKKSSRSEHKSQRNRKLASTDDSGLSDSGQQSPNNSLTHSDVAKLNQKKKSTFWPSPFGKSQEKEDLLRLKLESWSTNGLPAMPDLITIGKRHFDRAAFELPANWQDIVQHQDLTKRQRDQQERVWELLKTEVKYILRLSVIKDLFMCCLINLQNEGVLNEIDSEQVFSNILDVHEGNALLWQDHMREVVVKSKEEDTPLDPSYMKEGFQSIGELLHPYTKYCLEQEPCQEYIKKKCHESELFKIFVEWCEAQKQCNRLKLTDLMVSPMHRLTRYKLLLEAIIKYTEDDTQKEDLLMMVEKVNAFAKQVDNAMRQKQEQSRLSKIINRIESYEAVEAPNEECARLIGQFNRIDLTMPMQGCSSQQKRHLIKEGSLKLRDSTIKTEVYVFLFTDMLLLTKCKERKSDRVKVIKPPMRLDHVLVFMLKDGISFLLVHLNEFNVASAMYTLHGEAKNWVTYIEKAQKDYRNLWKLNLERPETGLEYLNTSDEEDEYSGDFNITEHLALSRVESMSSADVFIPNIGNISHISRSNSHSSLVRNQSLGDERIHASSPLLHDESFKKPRSMTYHDDLQGHSQGHSQGHQGHFSNRGHHLSHKSLSETSDDSFTSLSLPLRETKSGSGSISTADDDSTSTPLPGRPDLLLEENRSKLANRRKSGAEKRYYTADHIQDLQAKEKDTSIHKRYSLNFGNNANERSAALHDKTISSDSLRSMPSSSGVSSTGSLHLSPDTDIYEECESENASVSSIRYVPPTTQVPDRISEEDPSNLSSTESSSSQSHDVAAVKKFSKSLPDVSTLMSLSKSTPAEDGIASVQLLKHEGEKKKLTHAEMRKITKNLLLNSTLEATEV